MEEKAKHEVVPVSKHRTLKRYTGVEVNIHVF